LYSHWPDVKKLKQAKKFLKIFLILTSSLILRYEGDFVDGKMTGKGTYYWQDGDRYEGDFVDGVRTGKGTYYWQDGNRYEGDFLDDIRTGKGTLYWLYMYIIIIVLKLRCLSLKILLFTLR